MIVQNLVILQYRDHMYVELFAGKEIILALAPNVAPWIPGAQALPLVIKMVRKGQFWIGLPRDDAQRLPVFVAWIECFDGDRSKSAEAGSLSSLAMTRAKYF